MSLDMNHVCIFAFVTFLLLAIRFLIYPIFRRHWPFWKVARWQPEAWNKIIAHYRAAVGALRRHPWFVGIPLALTLVSQTVYSLMLLRALDKRSHFAASPHHLVVSASALLSMAIKSFINALDEIHIDWPGVAIWYFGVLLILVYYIGWFWNIRGLRRRFYDSAGPGPLLIAIHSMGAICLIVGLAITLLVVVQINRAAQLIAKFGSIWRPLQYIVSTLSGLPFLAFFSALIAKLLKALLDREGHEFDWHIGRSSHLGLLFFCAIMPVFGLLGPLIHTLLDKTWIWLSGSSFIAYPLFEWIYYALLYLVLLPFVFTPLFITGSEERVGRSMKRSAELVFGQAAAFLQLLLPALLCLFALGTADALLHFYFIPDLKGASNIPVVLISRPLFFLVKVVWPMIRLAVVLIMVLALTSFWLERSACVPAAEIEKNLTDRDPGDGPLKG